MAASVTRKFARSMGFNASAASDLAICAAELASNAVRHAGSGTLEVREVTSPSRGIEIVVRDEGPGIADPELAIVDGWSRGKLLTADAPPSAGLGKGLGAVLRLVDDANIDTGRNGTTVTVRRYVVRPRTRGA
ncbi:MAG TPA: ATP-binding protein [Labilithrix sp.]|nr:ATP-binding protein [Labilithrix sp.]